MDELLTGSEVLCKIQAKCTEVTFDRTAQNKFADYYELMADKPKTPLPEAIVDKALDDPQVPKLYANSFGVGLTNADIFILFQRSQRPVAVVNLSYTLAKTLAQRLGALVAEFETNIAEQSILTTDRIDEANAKKKGSTTKPSDPTNEEVH